MRMALILKLLEEAEDPVKVSIDTTDLVYGRTCTNPKCISCVEQELPQISRITDAAENIHRCIYCEQKV
jgi:aspartate carbamoyltransferase regulatory subunit